MTECREVIEYNLVFLSNEKLGNVGVISDYLCCVDMNCGLLIIRCLLSCYEPSSLNQRSLSSADLLWYRLYEMAEVYIYIYIYQI